MNDDVSKQQEERRRHDRHGLQMAMTLRQSGQSRRTAVLKEASTHGVRLRAYLEPRPDREYWLRIPGLESQLGVLSWSQGQEHGFRLVHPLHPAVLDRIVSEANAAAAPAMIPAPANDDVRVEPPQSEDGSRRDRILRGDACQPSITSRKEPREGGRTLFSMIRRQARARVADHRLEPRYPPPGEGVRLRVDDDDAEVLDLSASGVRVDLNLARGGIGADVAVTFENCEELTGRVVWIRDGAAGLALPRHSIDLHAREDEAECG